MKVTYDKTICTHSANCVKTLPSVFQVKDGNFVITQDGATEEQIRKTVSQCPSKALKIE
ncbi:MAG: (4Fe-4S)-binding protein [Nitrosopumilus sp.]|nr:(4Fe-4S)-binding protein [Nitrosopumilus sp.]MDH3489830.1 (4Fe-4S)-binding protein [Nitrosopumilus sp.]MDH3516653.1 (4Fe-4S)-binding protein [Nitrosopumilus sp.]MDH3564661.1 (4Fe-4S)-binding protein [Nitrosopumilus sp.]MDH5416872.1 (4Fe-4S)-binding protein [Nitrosopumilus sp.]